MSSQKIAGLSKFSQSWVPLFRKADTCDVDVALERADRVKHLKMIEVDPDHLVLAEAVVYIITSAYTLACVLV